MRSSRWVCWALMLRSSVSLAMIFRNRNLQASQREGWGAAHPGPTYCSWTTLKSPKIEGFNLRTFQVSPRKGSVELLKLVFQSVDENMGQPWGLEVLYPHWHLLSLYMGDTCGNTQYFRHQVHRSICGEISALANGWGEDRVQGLWKQWLQAVNPSESSLGSSD